MKQLIRGGTVVTERGMEKADILIDGETIQMVDTLQDPVPDAAVIDASGKYILPGAVDVHTHMDLDCGRFRAVDDFYTGTVAAAYPPGLQPLPADPRHSPPPRPRRQIPRTGAPRSLRMGPEREPRAAGLQRRDPHRRRRSKNNGTFSCPDQ